MPELGKYIKKLKQFIAEANNILLICHVNPDGDAVGSMLAFYHYLTTTGKNVTMLSPNYLQDFLKWMNGADQINIYLRNRKRAAKIIEESDLIIFLDFNNPNRLGEAEKVIRRAVAKKIIIDHHVDPQDFADLIISEPGLCATSELIYHLVETLEGKPFSGSAYDEGIYVGIITDTANFEHGSYSGDTMRITADMIDRGIEKEKIFDNLYNNFSYDRMRLQGLALSSRMKIVEGYPVAYIWLTREDLNLYNYAKGDTEGFVNMPLGIRGISVTAMFVEKEGFIKVSFRSKGIFSVNDFAVKYFNGGGHRNAAGGEFYDSLEKAISFFHDSIVEEMSSIAEDNK